MMDAKEARDLLILEAPERQEIAKRSRRMPWRSWRQNARSRRNLLATITACRIIGVRNANAPSSCTKTICGIRSANGVVRRLTGRMKDEIS